MFWKHVANLQENTHSKVCSSVNLPYIFRTHFSKNTSGGLVLKRRAFEASDVCFVFRFGQRESLLLQQSNHKRQKQPPDVFYVKRCSSNFTISAWGNFIKKLRRCFPVNFVKFLTAPFLKNTIGRLLLKCSEWVSVGYLGTYQTSFMERFCEKSTQSLTVNYFRKKAPS